jgi:hypothetical protein
MLLSFALANCWLLTSNIFTLCLLRFVSHYVQQRFPYPYAVIVFQFSLLFIGSLIIVLKSAPCNRNGNENTPSGTLERASQNLPLAALYCCYHVFNTLVIFDARQQLLWGCLQGKLTTFFNYFGEVLYLIDGLVLDSCVPVLRDVFLLCFSSGILSSQGCGRFGFSCGRWFTF